MDSDLSCAAGHSEGRKSDAEYQGGLCHAGAKNPRCRKRHFPPDGAAPKLMCYFKIPEKFKAKQTGRMAVTEDNVKRVAADSLVREDLEILRHGV